MCLDVFLVQVVDASKSFYEGTTKIDGTLTSMLKETIKPEHKRKIIGDTFMRVSEEVRPAATCDRNETCCRYTQSVCTLGPTG